MEEKINLLLVTGQAEIMILKIKDLVNLDLSEKKDLNLNQKMKDTEEKIHPALVTDQKEKVVLKIEIEKGFNQDLSNFTPKTETHPLLKSLVETTSLEL